MHEPSMNKMRNMNNMNKGDEELLPSQYGYGQMNKFEKSSPLHQSSKVLSKTRDWVTTQNPLRNASKRMPPPKLNHLPPKHNNSHPLPKALETSNSTRHKVGLKVELKLSNP